MDGVCASYSAGEKRTGELANSLLFYLRRNVLAVLDDTRTINIDLFMSVVGTWDTGVCRSVKVEVQIKCVCLTTYNIRWIDLAS